jgi:hypothetical protein
MNVPLIDEIAAHIRRVDGSNKMPARVVGTRIANFLDGVTDGSEETQIRIEDFVERTNLDKTVGAGALAELIVAEFRLDEAAR